MYQILQIAQILPVEHRRKYMAIWMTDIRRAFKYAVVIAPQPQETKNKNYQPKKNCVKRKVKKIESLHRAVFGGLLSSYPYFFLQEEILPQGQPGRQPALPQPPVELQILRNFDISFHGGLVPPCRRQSL